MSCESVDKKKLCVFAHLLIDFVGSNVLRSKEERLAVAYVQERLCIGCDQCTIVCDDDAIEMYKVAMASPLIQLNQKAKILRDDCTGCRLCVLACPTDAISMIDR